MEALFIFIAKSSGLLLLFFCGYHFLLRKETFFNSNRWFLLAGLLTSVILPFLVYTKVVWINPTSVSNMNYTALNPLNADNNSFELNWNLVFIAVYIIGFIGFVIKFGIDFYSLNSILKGKKVQQQADFKFIDVKENIAPFSYFDYIVYNSSMYTASELENILEHEKVHSDQNHTVDVLISRVFCILFWFNPIIWFYKKAIVQNLEFIADKEAAQNISDKKSYQYTLLKITTHENCLAITNHFYQSLIKKRIIMLNKNQSKKSNSWKYYVVVPALAVFVLLFQVEVIAKEKRGTAIAVSKKEIKSVDVYKIKKTTTDQELKVIAEKLKLNYNVDFTIAELKRNSQNEITAIKVHAKSGSEQVQEYEVRGDKGIKDCGIMITTDDNGSKKISLVANNKLADSSDKAHKIEIVKVQNSKTNTDVNINSNTSTKADCIVNTATNTIVSTNTNGNTSTIVTVANNNGQQTIKIKSDPLYIVDGTVIGHLSTDDAKSLDDLNIKSVNVYKGMEATVRYGEDGSNGVVIIETKK
ncbi:M56 family metallopeptidase [uncultured Flavobacterium sp.]|uniref:M56 family metallopeptidase n=1 Tax=uncultured Flavobacterium sp. TaxID=165435 RepID=UPI00292EEE5F|nr:M56 family metallopeptidase [uncultured Flavobacterium sp.]